MKRGSLAATMLVSFLSVLSALYTYFTMDFATNLPVPLHELDNHQIVLESTDFVPSPASLPVSNSTRAFWLHPTADVNPLAKEGSEGPLTGNADICIIGSGITGISAAYHLSRLFQKQQSVDGMKVVVLEARDFCQQAYPVQIVSCGVCLSFCLEDRHWRNW